MPLRPAVEPDVGFPDERNHGRAKICKRRTRGAKMPPQKPDQQAIQQATRDAENHDKQQLEDDWKTVEGCQFRSFFDFH